MKDKKAHEKIGKVNSDVSALKMTVNVLHHNDLERLKHENVILKDENDEMKKTMETLRLQMIAIGKQLAKVTNSDNKQAVQIKENSKKLEEV